MMELWFSSPASLLEGLRHAYNLSASVTACVSVKKKRFTLQAVATGGGGVAHEYSIPLWQHIVCGVANHGIETFELQAETPDSVRFVHVLADSSKEVERRKTLMALDHFIFDFGVSKIYKELLAQSPPEIYTIVARIWPSTREISWLISPDPEHFLYSRIMGAAEMARLFGGGLSEGAPSPFRRGSRQPAGRAAAIAAAALEVRRARRLTTFLSRTAVTAKKQKLATPKTKTSASSVYRHSDLLSPSSYSGRGRALIQKRPQEATVLFVQDPLGPETRDCALAASPPATSSHPDISTSNDTPTPTTSAAAAPTTATTTRARRRKGQDVPSLVAETHLTETQLGLSEIFYALSQVEQFAHSPWLRLPAAELQLQLSELAVIGNGILHIHTFERRRHIMFSSRHNVRDLIQYRFCAHGDSGYQPLTKKARETEEARAEAEAVESIDSEGRGRARSERKRTNVERADSTGGGKAAGLRAPLCSMHVPPAIYGWEGSRKVRRSGNLRVPLRHVFIGLASSSHTYSVTLYFDSLIGLLAEWGPGTVAGSVRGGARFSILVKPVGLSPPPSPRSPPPPSPSLPLSPSSPAPLVGSSVQRVARVDADSRGLPPTARETASLSVPPVPPYGMSRSPSGRVFESKTKEPSPRHSLGLTRTLGKEETPDMMDASPEEFVSNADCTFTRSPEKEGEEEEEVAWMPAPSPSSTRRHSPGPIAVGVCGVNRRAFVETGVV